MCKNSCSVPVKVPRVPRFPNKMSVADLIKCLEAIVACDEIEPERILNWGYIEDRHPLLQEADKLANKLLLTDGDRNRVNEQELMMNSPFRVTMATGAESRTTGTRRYLMSSPNIT